ncbi:hypothetical protein FNV43_RR00787 [Rhamnella rubrinervis]|uniref:F-box domain-containing protein n=1 Tax=Rhamnella rubrinervis TaxID=2594499 RepID=A0A8K0HNG3_9ROSA|nr:hypothetical protein FNV43_RR00787 [Rhamnella rubrinervis]
MEVPKATMVPINSGRGSSSRSGWTLGLLAWTREKGFRGTGYGEGSSHPALCLRAFLGDTPRKRGKITSEGMKDRKRRRKEKHTTNATATTSAVDVMVKDVMDDILGKLPLKSLVRFKCVCKAWNSSIPRIAKSIYGPPKIIVAPSHSRPYTSIKIVDHEAAAASSDTDSETDRVIRHVKLPLDAPGKVVGSCNGLLVIEFGRRKKKFVLWNPLLKEFKILPDLKPSNNRLVFSSMIGFGHDGCSDDYKVVRIFAYEEDSSFEALVYSLKTNSWRYLKLEQPFSNNTIYEFLKHAPSMGTLVNGALYWPVTDFDSRWWSHTFRFWILRFHLADEKLSWTRAPDFVNTSYNLRLMVFEGNKLCAYQNVHARSDENTMIRTKRNYEIRMWVLEEEEGIEEWTKLMSIPICQRFAPTFKDLPESNFAPLAFMRDGRVLICKNDSGIEDCRLYNPKADPKNNPSRYVELGIESWYDEQFTYEASIESFDGWL